MSGYKLHLTVGLIVAFIISALMFYFNNFEYTPLNVVWLLIIATIFSLLPDIDIGTSMIRKVFLIAVVVFIFINGVGLWGYILGAIVIIIQFLPHRGIMHSPYMGVLLSAMIYFYFGDWAFSFIAMSAFGSHLILDEF